MPPVRAVAGDDLRAQLAALHAASFGWAMLCCDYRREDAEDVLQTAYCKILAGTARYAGRSSVKTWLFGVIRNTALDQRRRHRVGHLALLRLQVDPAAADRAGLTAGASPSSAAAAADAASVLPLLAAALGRLPRRQAEVIHLVFYEEQSLREAATMLGIGLGSARRHYERAKRKLREHLAPMLADPVPEPGPATAAAHPLATPCPPSGPGRPPGAAAAQNERKREQ